MILRRKGKWEGKPATFCLGPSGPGQWSVWIESAPGVMVYRGGSYGSPMLAGRRLRKLRDRGGLAETNMRRAEFTTGEGGLTLRGWTDGETWNGWATPWFDRTSGELICRWLVQRMDEDSGLWDGQPVISWDAGRQTFISELGASPVWVSPVRTLAGGERVYQVTDGWTWDEMPG